MIKALKQLVLLAALLVVSEHSAAEYLDSIVAVVEDDVILFSELQREMAMVRNQIAANNMTPPPDRYLYKQVIERLILTKLQRLLAARSGIKISEEMLTQSLSDIAAQNNMTLDEFQTELTLQGMSYNEFAENVRNEIIINQLRGREIGERVKVTDREVQHYLETHQGEAEQNKKYHIGHILISLPEGAASDDIQAARNKAEKIVNELRNGADFKETAIAMSDGGKALEGGDLGWRKKSQLPTIFVDQVDSLQAGMISDPIRSPSGFHIIKMLDLQGEDKHMVTQTKVRHILIKTNELVDDKEARRQLLLLKERIIDGDDFGSLAQSHSDDQGSAIKGGDLGWVVPGALVPPFEKAMNKLKISEISDPVQSQFGWHLIQVLDREQKDDSEEYKRNLAREEIRKRKIEEETELWLRRLRDEAYVDIRMGS